METISLIVSTVVWSSHPVLAVTWWSPDVSAVMGILGGGTVGFFGALIGVLAGAGKGEKFIFSTLRVIMYCGICALTAGTFALLLKQPYHVFFTLIMVGILMALVSYTVYPLLKARFEK